MLEYMFMPLRRYAEFSGRSRRKEYWSFALFIVLVYALIAVLVFGTGAGFAEMVSAVSTDPENPLAVYSVFMHGNGLLFTLWWLVTFIPGVAVGVRRLHDRNMSGWWYLGFFVANFIPLINIVGSLTFLVIMLLPGTPGPNRFGPDPKDPANVSVFD